MSISSKQVTFIVEYWYFWHIQLAGLIEKHLDLGLITDQLTNN